MAATATSTTEARSNRLQIGNTGEIVPIRLHQRAKFTVIGLDGDVDIQAAVELKGILLSALLSQQELRIELAELTTLDVTVVQLLWATQHAAATTGTQVILDGPFPEGVKQAMDFANIERAPVNSK
jgi:anti-anti-sigma regulatory factor